MSTFSIHRYAWVSTLCEPASLPDAVINADTVLTFKAGCTQSWYTHTATEGEESYGTHRQRWNQAYTVILVNDGQ